MKDISIVIPARNAAATLGETLRSVLDAPEVGEVIVVNDGSTDDTAGIAGRVGDPRIRVIPGPQSGVAAALNTGLAAVTLPLVARCDADDLYPPGRLAWQRKWLAAHPGFVAVSGGFATMFPDGTRAGDLACSGTAREVTDQLLRGEPVTHLCAWLMRAEALARVGGARVWFASAEDVDLQFRLAEVGRVWHVPRMAYLYRLHDASITHRSNSAAVSFFDQQARRFAMERRTNGQDPLKMGCPPAPPDLDTPSKGRKSAKEHAIGHAIGAAWKEFEAGSRGDAYRRLHTILLEKPFSGTLWRHVLVLNAKHLKRSLF